MTHVEAAPCARGCKHPDHRPVPAIGKTQLCGPCHRKYAAAVNDLGDLWPTLVGSQVRGSTALKPRVQSSSTIEAGSEWRPGVTGVMAEVTEWTGYIRRQVDADARNRITKWPTDTRVVLYALGRPAAARYLTHVHPLAPSFVDEALKLRKRAHDVLNSDYVRRYPLGVTCQAIIYGYDEETVCGAQLVGTIEPESSGRESAIRCVKHPTEHKVAPDQWQQLADYLEELRA